MPLDSTCYDGRSDVRIQKLDRVIAALPNFLWVQKVPRASNGRRCLDTVLEDFGVNVKKALTPPILAAARQVTGKEYNNVPQFNDADTTTYAMLMQVLQKTRQNFLDNPISPDPSTRAKALAGRTSFATPMVYPS